MRFEGKPAPNSFAPWSALADGAGHAQAEQEPLDDLLVHVLSQAGLEADLYRAAPLRRRLGACLRALKARSAQEARESLGRQPDLLPAAVSSLLIGVTNFFRDKPVFDQIAARALPELAGRKRLRVWSAACSNGAELYSVAILLAEAGLLGRSSLLGTDCRGDAIEQAREARYSDAELASVEPSIRERYFIAAPGGFRPTWPLRRRARWDRSDIALAVEPGPWDLVLWRNAGIYLRPHWADLICRRLADVLAPGGYLVVGKAERPPAELPLACVGRCIYRKGGKRAAAREYGETG